MVDSDRIVTAQSVEVKENREWRKRLRLYLYKSVDKVHLPTIRTKLTPLLGYPIGGSWPEA